MKLLAPAGNFSSLAAALKAGADSVYFGTKLLNMRARARNFELNQLKKVVERCHDYGAESWLTLNIQIYDNEIETAEKVLNSAAQAEVDGVIVWDPAVISLAAKMNIPFHISTQASVANVESALFYENLGAKAVVFARDLSLESISRIKQKLKARGSNLKMECFGHGAMCVAVSGRCFLSQFMFGQSGNRGECLQPCRRSYEVKDTISGQKLRLENHTIFSPRDLCTIPVLNQIMAAGVDLLKIEGRNRSADYVFEVVKTYRQALDAASQGKLDQKKQNRLVDNLRKIYNKGFHTGFYEKPPGPMGYSREENSSGLRKKFYLGRIDKIYRKIAVNDIIVHSGQLKTGQKVLILGKTTGVEATTVTSIYNDNHQSVEFAEKGQLVGVKFAGNPHLHCQDKVFVFEKPGKS
ncbi:MAG: U32 family peptidase [Deltaproteobacteria bacterium]|jgi:putative protease|nr:U32 family peptidase [Deltaproteobacteria bacterium]